MTADEPDPIPENALEDSVLVIGGEAVGRSVAARFADADGVRVADGAPAPDAVVLAVDAGRSDGTDLAFPSLPDAVVRFAVVAVPEQPTSDEQAVLDAIEPHVDAIVLTSERGIERLAAAVDTLVSVVRDTGLVNVDLADVETVFRPVELAVLGVGAGAIDEPTAAARDAIAALPGGVETDAAGGALVDLIGPPGMSIADVDGAVSAVRNRIGPEAHLIWGGSVDPALEGELTVRLVVAGVESVRVTAGDDCPRCGTPLSAYTLDGRTMLSCEACGFADVSVRLRG